jgi:hypothetical protein
MTSQKRRHIPWLDVPPGRVFARVLAEFRQSFSRVLAEFWPGFWPGFWPELGPEILSKWALYPAKALMQHK